MLKLNKIKNYIYSFISLMGFLFITNLNKNSFFINSILCIILYLSLYKIISKYLSYEKENKRLKVFSILLSIIFSFTFVVGYNLTMYDQSYLGRIPTYIQIVSILPLLISIFKFLLVNIDKFREKAKKSTNHKLDQLLFQKHAFIKSLGLIILAWIPVFLAFYPGIFSYDSSVQLNEVMNNSLSNGSPIAHTVIVGGCVKLGKFLFHSYNTGIAIYSIIQMILLASAFAFVIYYFNKKKAPFLLKIITLIIFMFLPTFSTMAITTTKDVFFASFVTMLFPFLMEMVTNTESYFKSKKKIIITIILILLTCIFRHNGYYSFLVLSIFLIIGLRKHWKKILLIILTCIVAYKSYLFGITKMLNLTSENVMAKSAIMCIPIQQFGRLYTSNVKLTNYEKKMLDALVTNNAYRFYESHKSDAIAWYFNGNKIYDEPIPYMKLYVKLGLKHPIIYIDAFLANTMGYWYIGDLLPDQGTYRTYIEIRTIDDFKNTNNEIKFDSKLPKLFEVYYDLIEKAEYQKIPILSLLMSVPFHIMLLLMLSIIAIYEKKYKKIIPLSFFYGLMLTLLLGPVALLRYSLSVLTCIELIVYLVVFHDDKQKDHS